MLELNDFTRCGVWVEARLATCALTLNFNLLRTNHLRAPPTVGRIATNDSNNNTLDYPRADLDAAAQCLASYLGSYA